MLETLYTTTTQIEQTQIKQFLQEAFPGLKAFYFDFKAGRKTIASFWKPGRPLKCRIIYPCPKIEDITVNVVNAKWF